MHFQQQEYILQFLIGLNDSYSQARAQILMLDHLPPINEMFSLIIQDERYRGLRSYMPTSTSNTPNSNTIAFGISASNYNTHKGKQIKPICTHCGKLGHTTNNCYKLHGFPPGYKFKNHHTGQSNPSKPVINQIGVGLESTTANFAPSIDPLQTKNAVHVLTPSQFQQIIALLSSFKEKTQFHMINP
ncbi:Retrotran gag 3 domain-containing protein [Abeliophyllum distichum]|uniref:Retrotran gag 3 domain-containing protein n=1 Tax=Abeliophyllum distichum TaxID=126358 RepID=A0ABD1SC09_9LAMI